MRFRGFKACPWGRQGDTSAQGPGKKNQLFKALWTSSGCYLWLEVWERRPLKGDPPSREASDPQDLSQHKLREWPANWGDGFFCLLVWGFSSGLGSGLWPAEEPQARPGLHPCLSWLICKMLNNTSPRYFVGFFQNGNVPGHLLGEPTCKEGPNSFRSNTSSSKRPPLPDSSLKVP